MLAVQTVDVVEFAQRHDLEWVVLFGSRARGRGRENSDYDLALMPASDAVRVDENLEHALGLMQHLGRADIDATWIPTAPWLLAWHVARDGVVLYEATPGAFSTFRTAARLRRMDSETWRRRELAFVDSYLSGGWRMDRELVSQHLTQMLEYLGELESWLGAPEEEFLSDARTFRAVERDLELLVECATTINTEVAQAAGIPPSDYYSSFFSLQRSGWIDQTTAQALGQQALLRDLLVHQYAKVQLPKLYLDTRNALKHWKAYVGSVRRKLADGPGWANVETT